MSIQETYLPKQLDTWKVDIHQWACKGMQSGFKRLSKQLKVQSQ